MRLCKKIAVAVRSYSEPFYRGSEVAECEDNLSRYFGTGHSILVSSGTAALHTALIACGVVQGDEVIVPALAPVMTVAPVIYIGAIPVFVDCSGRGTDLDCKQLDKAVTAKTKAIVPVHLWGIPCDMRVVMRFARKWKLKVIEDACQAHGSRWGRRMVGTFGNCGCFSTRSGKLMSTGEGGFIVTNSTPLASACRLTISHNVNTQDLRKSFKTIGYNYRPTALQAVLTSAELLTLDQRIRQRRNAIFRLVQQLEKISSVRPLPLSVSAGINGYCAVLMVGRKYPPRSIARRLAAKGTHNSVGTFGLRALPKWKSVAKSGRLADARVGVRNCERMLGRALAILLKDGTPKEVATILNAILQSMNDQ